MIHFNSIFQIQYQIGIQPLLHRVDKTSKMSGIFHYQGKPCAEKEQAIVNQIDLRNVALRKLLHKHRNFKAIWHNFLMIIPVNKPERIILGPRFYGVLSIKTIISK